MYACTPNCLHKRGSGQEATLFLCTCLGDLASLARAADRADPEGVQMLSLRKLKHVQPFIHVSFHCQAKCFHCASSFLFLQPTGRPFAKTQNDANWKVIVGSQAPRSKEPDSDDVRDDGDDDFDEQRNDDADDERQDETRRENQAHVCVAFKARAFQGHLEASPELPYHRGVTGVAEIRLGSGN